MLGQWECVADERSGKIVYQADSSRSILSDVCELNNWSAVD